jgi:hypothetical protein
VAALATDAAHAHERHGAHAHAVGAEQDHLQGVRAAAQAAVAPQLHLGAQAGFHQGAVGLADADLGGQADVFLAVLAGGAGAAVEAGDVDDVRPGLGHAHGDGAHAAGHGDLHRHARQGVGGLELGDDLGQILDAVDVVVVGG